MSGCAALLSVLTLSSLPWPAVGQNKFTVSVEQDVYQAEENSNITMTWLLHFDSNRPPDVLIIDLMNVKRWTQIFSYDTASATATDTEMYPDEFYKGRLQCDPRLARTGRLECLLTDLRLTDTGTYHCTVVLNGEMSSKPCDLNVTAAIRKPVGETSKPVSRERIAVYTSLGVSAAVITAFSLRYLMLNTFCK